MQILENNKPLAAVVCGFPGGGTTMLTEILRQHPRLDSGFEGGFLLVDEAKDFKNLEPYCSILKKTWNITDEALAKICDVDNWPAVYRRLRQKSPVIEDKTVFLFDKTPRYMMHLKDVLNKVPNVPCIVITRDPRATFWTRVKRTFRKAPSNITQEQWIQMELEGGIKAYLLHAQGWQDAMNSGLSERILLVNYEILCLNSQQQIAKIFDFLNLRFKKDYLSFQERVYNYHPCHGSELSTDYIKQYEKHLSSTVCSKILEMTEDFKDFWFDT